jgi:hypothetical protein
MDESSFFSMDKLVEFGIGMAISRQMVETMNQTIANTQIAGTMNPHQNNNDVALYYFVLDGKSSGPFSIQETITLVQQKIITKDTLAWKPGFSAWIKIENDPLLLKYIALQPPQIPSNL